MLSIEQFLRNASTRNLVINSDLDGFLSGMILQHFYNCKIVGFTNSKDSLWISPEIKSIHDVVFIDIFITNPNIYCIDQHIVAYDNTYIDLFLSYNTKLNPNLNLSRRTFAGDLGAESDYFHKYPFGTVHFILSIMKTDNHDLDINSLLKIKSITGIDNKQYEVCPLIVLLRADNALQSSIGAYRSNWENGGNYLVLTTQILSTK